MDFDVRDLQNCDKVGENCLKYVEAIDGVISRYKIYNKKVQMMECKGAIDRGTIGCHWKDWVCQIDTRLVRARDKARLRGLTRAFYCDQYIPSDEIMEDCLQRIVRYVDPSLVYSTPYASVWKNYCDAMKHNLVVVDRSRDTALIVYTYNELTNNISGQYISNWQQKEMWVLANLTLNGNLPVDIIDMQMVRKSGKKDNLSKLLAGSTWKFIRRERTTFRRELSVIMVYSHSTRVRKKQTLCTKCWTCVTPKLYAVSRSC